MISLAVVLALQSTTALVDDASDPIGDLIAQNAPEARDVAEPGPMGCRGRQEQGALIICRFEPGTRLDLGQSVAIADAQGFAVLGIPRNAPEEMIFEISTAGVANSVNQIDESPTWFITQREYNLQHVDGVPQATVTPDPSTLPRRQREYAQKQDAFNSVWDGQGFLDGFISPAEGITTGVYGSARVYNNGHEGSPHWGLDWANEVGTPVYAPAGGLVTLAEPDMYYEGGLIFIDHGQGLVSAFLHLSGVEVSAGDVVEQGQLIGAMGAGGRATGSHLDWRVKLRNQFYVDPQSLLDLDLSDLR
ncbi:M23 family metallopeptidase [Maricaulis maris]|jgi:Peptidase family M23|uniref:M23 family metallopeptidase n=1 Tax=Maricaulis maris TaxID=74318 RepID=UPI00292031A9|nr:periplasmic metalloprotease M23B family protein [Maricaulis maris]